MIGRLLYLTYIPLEDNPTSGSSVRPQKMKDALDSLGIEVKTFGGISNNIGLRKRTVKEIKNLLKTWRPDACYIEPPAGPMFFYGDVGLIKQLHRMGIPMSIFYRDAYWKYPEFGAENELTVKDRIKRSIVKCMQMYQWDVFRKSIDLIYFPSMTMAKEFDCPRKDTLPPGGFVPDVKEKNELSQPLQFIFVGGATRNYGTHMTLEAFSKANNTGTVAKLFYICPEKQWAGLGLDITAYSDWLEVVHTSGDDNLKPYYEKADVALLTAPKTFYRDFAVPIKIFEYLSYLKPVLVTDCTETAKIIRDNQIGWIVKDDPDCIANKIQELCSYPDEIYGVKEHMKTARSNNLWSSRAEKVIKDLESIKA